MTIPMRRLRRFLLRKRVLIPLGVGVLLMFLGYFVALPWVVRGRVKAVLHQLKLDDATFRVSSATPWASIIRDIDAGDGNRIDELRVTYSAGRLWDRRIDRVQIKGLQLTADVRDGKATIPALDALLRAPAAATRATQPVTTTAPATPPKNWPFLSITIADSKLIVRTPERQIDVPAEGRLVGRQLDLKLSSAGGTVGIAGTLGDERGAQELTISLDNVSGRDLSTILSGIAPKMPLRIASTVDGKGTARRVGDDTAFSLDLTAVPAAADEPAASATSQLANTNVNVEEGVLHVEGNISRGGGGGGTVRVKADNVALAEVTLGATASGIDGDVSFVHLAPAATAQDQVVRIDKLSASKVNLTDGVAQFDVSPDGSLNVDEMRWSFLGGELSAKDVRIVPGEPVKLTLVVTNVQLRDLLALLTPGKATGEGKVSGQLPLVIAPSGAVTLGEGSAEATAGGTLSVTDEDTLAAVAGDAAKQASGGGGGKGVTSQAEEQVRKDVVSAMKDFEFKSLTARLKNEPDKGVVANVRIKGQGRGGAKQGLDYELRVHGLSELFRSAIGLQRAMTRQREAATP